MPKNFAALHTDSVVQQSAYVLQQKFFLSQTLWHRKATPILGYKVQSECIFSSVCFSDSVQHLSAYNIAKYCTLALH